MLACLLALNALRVSESWRADLTDFARNAGRPPTNGPGPPSWRARPKVLGHSPTMISFAIPMAACGGPPSTWGGPSVLPSIASR